MRQRYATPEQFKAARKKVGLTQKAAAELCGVDHRTYQRWESGETRGRQSYLDRLKLAKRST